MLTPDFVDNLDALDRVIESAPEVFNHNVETVPRLYRKVRGPKSRYRWTLSMLRRIKERRPDIKTKSGLMLGLGETHGFKEQRFQNIQCVPMFMETNHGTNSVF